MGYVSLYPTFEKLHFYFHLIANILKFLLRFLSSVCFYALFNLQIFGNFSSIILLLFSSLIPLVSEDILCKISILSIF